MRFFTVALATLASVTSVAVAAPVDNVVARDPGFGEVLNSVKEEAARHKDVINEANSIVSGYKPAEHEEFVTAGEIKQPELDKREDFVTAGEIEHPELEEREDFVTAGEIELPKLEKRQGKMAAAGNAVIGGIVMQLTLAAINETKILCAAIKDWTAQREAFTKGTTQKMYTSQTNKAAYPAAVCYNMGWTTKFPSKIDGLASEPLANGVLNCNYDCMYLGKGNTFYINGDGGYINLAYTYDPSVCTYTHSTGSLAC